MGEQDGDTRLVGLLHVALGVPSAAVFLAVDSLDDTTGVLAGSALVAIGLATVAQEQLRVDLAAIDGRWRGALWVAVGGSVAALALAGAPTVGYLVSGLVVGGGVALYGLLLGLEW